MRQRILLLISFFVATSNGFLSPQLVRHHHQQHQQPRPIVGSSALYSVIKGEAQDAKPYDYGQGGVRLAEESAIKVMGEIKHKPGSANPKPTNMIRYTQMREIPENQVNQLVRIVCAGRGVELYKDPGQGTAKEVTLAPQDAVRDALIAAGTTQDADKLVINFLGGDDLIMMEVLDALEELVLYLDVKTSTKIFFNSLCYKAFPLEQATVTVVALQGGTKEGDQGSLSGEEQSIADGEVYFRDGKYYTVVPEDITTAVA